MMENVGTTLDIVTIIYHIVKQYTYVVVRRSRPCLIQKALLCIEGGELGEGPFIRTAGERSVIGCEDSDSRI